MLEALSLHFTVGFDRNTPSCWKPLASDTHLSKWGRGGKNLALCIRSIKFNGKNKWSEQLGHKPNCMCTWPNKWLSLLNFWAHSTHPGQNTDKWWRWSTECCGVLLKMSIICFTLTQRALRVIEEGAMWTRRWRRQGRRGRRREKRTTHSCGCTAVV